MGIGISVTYFMSLRWELRLHYISKGILHRAVLEPATTEAKAMVYRHSGLLYNFGI